MKWTNHLAVNISDKEYEALFVGRKGRGPGMGRYWNFNELGTELEGKD